MPNDGPFEDLFVLELANNHWGRLERGFKIVSDFAAVAHAQQVRAAIKLQFRDVHAFIHRDFLQRDDIRYIKKTRETRLDHAQMGQLVAAIRTAGCLVMATPFDEKSVDLCVELGIEIIKIASSDLTDRMLIEKILSTRKPAIVSTGGSAIEDIDRIVAVFRAEEVPLAINHCVSLYPSEDHELELNQIDFLRERYPNNTIGFSTHEYHDWTASVQVAYAKGARTFERHIDIQADGIPVSSYCTLPEQAETWFKAWHQAKRMCGGPGTKKRVAPQREVSYLDALVRGVYVNRDLPAGHVLCDEDVYFSVPLQKGQISSREYSRQEVLSAPLAAHAPVTLGCILAPYSDDEALTRRILARGL